MAADWDPVRFKAPPDSGQPRGDAALPQFDASGLVAGQEGDSAVADVLRRRGPELLEIDGVQGYGIGRSPAGDDAIVVYLLDAAAGASVPRELEGFTVLTKVTGIIKAQ